MGLNLEDYETCIDCGGIFLRAKMKKRKFDVWAPKSPMVLVCKHCQKDCKSWRLEDV